MLPVQLAEQHGLWDAPPSLQYHRKSLQTWCGTVLLLLKEAGV